MQCVTSVGRLDISPSMQSSKSGQSSNKPKMSSASVIILLTTTLKSISQAVTKILLYDDVPVEAFIDTGSS